MSDFRNMRFRAGIVLMASLSMLLSGALPTGAAVFPSDVAFGAVTVTQSDTLRLNVSNFDGDGSVEGVDVKPALAPPMVMLAFVSADGKLLKKMLIPSVMHGTSLSLELSFAEVQTILGGRTLQALVRPVVLFPPGPCKVSFSLEVVEQVTGATRLLLIPAVRTVPST